MTLQNQPTTLTKGFKRVSKASWIDNDYHDILKSIYFQFV